MSIDKFNHHKVYAAKKSDNIKRWHKQMNYFNAEYLQQILKIVKDMSLSSVKLFFCKFCVINKIYR